LINSRKVGNGILLKDARCLKQMFYNNFDGSIMVQERDGASRPRLPITDWTV
jgi:hypothetical protein